MNRTRSVGAALLLASIMTAAANAQEPASLAARMRGTSSVLERPARLEVHEVPLQQALVSLFEQSRVPVSFSPSLLPQLRVSCECRSVTVREALDRLLAGTRLHYREVRDLVLIVDVSYEPEITQEPLVSYATLRQVGRDIPVLRANPPTTVGVITGQVVDATTQRPLASASVMVLGTDRGAITGPDGRFTISGVPAGSYQVQAGLIGYGTLEQSVTVADGQTTTVTFLLQPEAVLMEGIVAVGYGTQQQRDVTGSVASIQSSDLVDSRISRVDEALLGRIPGVEVIQSTGEPGLGPRISIRGVGSITAGNDPLYVVDGYPIENIEMLNPHDMESISVLKDASATAIYGSRAANGVVLITTKKGRGDGTRINVDARTSWQQAADRPEFLNAYEQAEYYVYSIRARNMDVGNDVSGPPDSWAIRPPQTVLDVLAGQNNNDVDALGYILRTAPMHEVNVSATGSAGDFRYALSGGYLAQEGIVMETDFDRLTLRANVDGSLTDRLNLSLNINTALSERSVAETGSFGGGANSSIIAQAASAQPYYPLFNEDGSYFVYQNIDASTVLWNPVALAREYVNERQQSNVLSNLTLDYRLSDQFSLKQMLGGTVNASKSWDFRPRMEVFFNEPAEGNDRVDITTDWITETTLNYNGGFGDHNIMGLLGFTAQRNLSRANHVASTLYPSNLVPTLDGATITGGGSNMNEWSLLSYLARINYDYRSKYYVTASVRTDGSSRFGPNSKYATFPSLALAWRISEEPFFRVDLIDDLKLRASFGQTGNNDIGNYQHIAAIEYLRYTLGGEQVQGYAPDRVANPDLTWEKQRQYNFGADIAAFGNRVQLTLDHFRSTNYDLLLNVPVPLITGFGNSLQNIGEVKNTGWELALSTANVQTNRFAWNSTYNLSTYKNEVVKLGPDGSPILAGDNRHITMIGRPIGMHYGLKVDGIFMNQDEVDRGPLYNPGAPDQSRPGDIRFVDLNGDGAITSDDRTILGSPYPDFYFGSSQDFSYGNFSLAINLQGTYGNLVRNQNNVIFLLTRSRSRTLATQRNFWRSEEEPGDGKTPRPNDATTGGIRLHSERYLEDGSYLRINDIRLSYDLPEALTRRLGVGSGRAYVNASNPITLTSYTSWNPAAAASGNSLTPGVDQYQYPLAKSITLGLNLNW